MKVRVDNFGTSLFAGALWYIFVIVPATLVGLLVLLVSILAGLLVILSPFLFLVWLIWWIF